MEGSQRSAVVVGGGVAGLATGLALQRGGWAVRVLERAPALDQGGAGLVLWPNAVRCLAALGVDDEVRRRGTVLTESLVTSPDGRVLSRVGLADDDARATLGVRRADLVQVLAGALDPEVLELGTSVGRLDDLDADLVVGADGLRSMLRTTLWPEVRPVQRGCTVWRALLEPVGNDPHGLRGLTETWGRGVRFGVVPVGTDATYVYAVASAPPTGSRRDDLALVHRLFRSWHEPVPALLDRLDPATLLRHDVHDLPPGAVPLHHGRHVLVGDAAHAMEPNLGQGACLALEDAVVLGHHLMGSASTGAGVAAYDAARRRRVATLSRRSRRVGRLARLTHPGGTAARDAVMRATPDWCAGLALGGAADWHPPAPALVRSVSP